MKLLQIIFIGLCIAGGVGWIMSVVKFVKCDFQAPYKAEVIYGVGAFTGLGAVVGYINVGK